MDAKDFMYVCEQCGVDPLVASEDKGVKALLKRATNPITQQLMLSGYLHKNFNK